MGAGSASSERTTQGGEEAREARGDERAAVRKGMLKISRKPHGGSN